MGANIPDAPELTASGSAPPKRSRGTPPSGLSLLQRARDAARLGIRIRSSLRCGRSSHAATRHSSCTFATGCSPSSGAETLATHTVALGSPAPAVRAGAASCGRDRPGELRFTAPAAAGFAAQRTRAAGGCAAQLQ
ncbi:hypothetical protein CHLRE_13g606950v5 [Chlamydomonas reinhardtii]|uniref:Uncharacterized protein n=1 Tax=Chlamydomonas reinhardtii TaxID=3055 RepID=A0A2K3D1K7_CHLRE|nr:uncharacterized protein CHLRE_13g606950v5 [Chlamydomonas reinhardtii]PNW74399.1 hypothetical protein CHLRE_13g606950v5 [Chlamydomonas reinhardtii]